MTLFICTYCIAVMNWIVIIPHVFFLLTWNIMWLKNTFMNFISSCMFAHISMYEFSPYIVQLLFGIQRSINPWIFIYIYQGYLFGVFCFIHLSLFLLSLSSIVSTNVVSSKIWLVWNKNVCCFFVEKGVYGKYPLHTD